ncbi:hypothetical protein LCGC14_1968270 [marine sediment metagenome]|uniref:Uncharacterized protein n=1 Tax=marine sediment metagenome TaxID=412755 RepID=A0A0F9G0Q4_9ZZZZ
MSDNPQIKKTTYLLAWVGRHKETPSAFFEVSTASLFRMQAVVSVGMQRGDHRVVVFCDFIHGDDYLTKDELRLVAACYLDATFNTIQVDLRN